MSHNSGSKLAGLTLAAILAGASLVPAAQATPITFYNNASTQDTERFTLGCGSTNGSCAGFLEAATSDTTPPSWSSSVGQMLGGPSNASPASETTFVNGLLGINLTATSSNIKPSNKNSAEFHTTADYFLIKVGGGKTHQAYAFLHNLDDNLDLYFTAEHAGGLSHYITFSSNGATGVPEPAALGMFGLGLALIGGFVALRRRNA